MTKAEIGGLLISEDEHVDKILETYDINKSLLLVVGAKNVLTGIIGLSEYNKIKGIKNKRASEVCNKNFSFVIFSDNIQKELEDIFCRRDIYYVPIVDSDRKVIDIMTRTRFNMTYRRILSYAQYKEDVILDHIFKDLDSLFYIDVGANDPWIDSVTKWLYDKRNARGINIEPQKDYYERLLTDRTDDINLCVGAGAQEDEIILYQDMGNSTCVSDFKTNSALEVKIHIKTLENICDEYVKPTQIIHFMKIDVEGYEEAVLRGMNFDKYRPWLLVLEAINPETLEAYYPWEEYLLSQGYTFAKQYDINRYYLCNEKTDLADRFIEKNRIEKNYFITNIKWY